MKTIFFLDDSPEFLFLVQKYIEHESGCKALTAESYDKTVLNEAPVMSSDMAFLDINLGSDVPSGIDVYLWLREKGYKKPIYFLTGHGANSVEVKKAAALGDVKILTKPLPHKTLLKLIECA